MKDLEKKQNRDLTDIIKSCAFLDSSIPYSLLESLLAIDGKKLSKIMESHMAASLLDIDAERLIIRQHTLIQKVLRDSMAQLEISNILSKILPGLIKLFPTHDLNSRQLKVFAPNVIAVATHAFQFVMKNNDLPEIANHTLALISNLVTYLLYFSYNEQALEHLVNLQKIQDKYQQSKQIASTYEKIGLAKKALGQYAEAISYFTKSYQIKESYSSEEIGYQDFARTKTHIAETYLKFGNNQEALVYCQQANELLKHRGLGTELYAFSLRVLGHAHLALDSFDDAIVANGSSISINDDLENAIDLAENYQLSGMIYLYRKDEIFPDKKEIGDLKKAEQDFKKAAKIYRRVYGENHPKTADIYDYTGLSLSSNGKKSAAIAVKYHEKALQINRDRFGENHIYCAINYCNFAFAYYTQAKYTDAKSVTLKASVFFKQTSNSRTTS